MVHAKKTELELIVAKQQNALKMFLKLLSPENLMDHLTNVFRIGQISQTNAAT